MYDISTLKEKKISELQDIAKSLKIKKITSLKKQELIYQIIDFLSTNPETNPKSETLKEDSSSENDNKLEKIFAEYNVELKSDGDIVRAENAIYSLKDNAISLVGNAHLIQGSNKILADKIFIDTETGIIKFSGSVKTTISPSTN